MNFEEELLYNVYHQLLNFNRQNEKIYEESLKFEKYMKTMQKLEVRLQNITKIVEELNIRETIFFERKFYNDQNKTFFLEEMGVILEDIKFVRNKLMTLKYDPIVLNMYRNNQRMIQKYELLKI